jgi:hypothetical protein
MEPERRGLEKHRLEKLESSVRRYIIGEPRIKLEKSPTG